MLKQNKCVASSTCHVIFPISKGKRSKDWFRTNLTSWKLKLFFTMICTEKTRPNTPRQCQNIPNMSTKLTLSSIFQELNQFSSSFSRSSGSVGFISSSIGITSWELTLSDATAFVTGTVMASGTVFVTENGTTGRGEGGGGPTSGGFSSPAKLSQESQTSLVDSVVPTLSFPFSISNKAWDVNKSGLKMWLKNSGGKSQDLKNELLASS